MRLLGLMTLAAAILAAIPAAHAKPTIITIRGDACDQSALEAVLTQMLATRAIGDSRVSVITGIGDGKLSAEVLFVDAIGQAHGPRVVTASTCDDLIDSIALVIVMAIPAPLVQEASDPATEPKIATPASGPATGLVVDEPQRVPAVDNLEVSRRASPGSKAVLSIDGYVGGASIVTSRGWNEQLLLGARMRRGNASFALQARLDAPEEVRVTSSGTVTVTQADLSIAPCAHWKSLEGCAVLSAGVLHGSGEAINAARSATTPVLASGLRVAWEHSVSTGWALRFHVDARALLTTTTFNVDYMPVWESSGFEGSAGVGVLARFL